MPLHKAAESGDIDAVQQLIGEKVNINSQTVVSVKHIYMFDWLVMSCAILQNGKTGLHLASGRGHVGVVQVLIEAHVPINQKDKVLYM